GSKPDICRANRLVCFTPQKRTSRMPSLAVSTIRRGNLSFSPSKASQRAKRGVVARAGSQIYSGRDRKRWHFRPLIDYLVDYSEILGHFRRHTIIALQPILHVLRQLAGMLSVDLVEPFLEIQNLLGVQHDVCRLALEAALGLMHQDAYIWQCKTLALFPGGEQQRSH